jgi:4-hydroxybenzoate polyprenyltransferase
MVNHKIKDALVLMRIPFSIYLMPVYWFALSCSFNVDFLSAIKVFVVIHFLVYPASNGYNSWCDKDEGSIGGLKKPPEVRIELLYFVIIFDILSILFSFLIDAAFGVMVILYLLASKAYSYPKTRIKKYAVPGALLVFVFQGAFTFFMIQKGIGNEFIFSANNLLYALVSSFFLLGSYPITQIYQHREDAKHGDKTLSMLLGVRRTFIFSGIVFAIATILLCFLYLTENKTLNMLAYLAAMIPVLFYFTLWMLRANKNLNEINFQNTMRMNKISSLCLSAAFIIMLFL